MKQTKTMSFGSFDYQIVAMDEASVAMVSGIDTTSVSLTNHAAATYGSFLDEQEVRERHWHFKPDDVVLDVGAAFGSYALTAALQGATVHAFEPSLFCRSILDMNVIANPKLYYSIQILPFGLHEKTGWFDPDANTFHNEATNPGCLKVVPLDELCLTGDIDMIKLDVEGGELSVLRGAEQTLKKHLPRLLIEEHEFKVQGIGAQCEDFLLKLGYSSPVRFPHSAVSHSFYDSPGK